MNKRTKYTSHPLYKQLQKMPNPYKHCQVSAHGWDMGVADAMKAIRLFIDGSDDPVRHCKVYNEIGCSHVDGYLCNMNTCSILKEYNDKMD